jgi:hypothetical protein
LQRRLLGANFGGEFRFRAFPFITGFRIDFVEHGGFGLLGFLVLYIAGYVKQVLCHQLAPYIGISGVDHVVLIDPGFFPVRVDGFKMLPKVEEPFLTRD